MAAWQDPEFGAITLRRTRLARSVRLRLDSRGIISMSLPLRTPLYIAKKLLEDSRSHLRQLRTTLPAKHTHYRDNDPIGKSHKLRFVDATTYDYQLEGNILLISRPLNYDTAQLQQTIEAGITNALRLQAKAYLPRRLRQLACDYGYSYQKVRCGQPGSRWGSCSSTGTISLNLWLMQLPFELIDYVIIHELCHTKYMNHRPEFWQLLATHCPNYKSLRRQLRAHHPHA